MSGTRSFWPRFRADRKKLGMSCACLALALLFWARLIVIADMPRTAIADPSPIDRPAEGAPSDHATSHNEADAIAPLIMDKTPSRDPFALEWTSSAPTQRSVAE